MSRSRRPLVLATPIVLLALGTPALAQIAVRIDAVPSPLSLPLPAGSNEMLTVRVTGGEARAVWLAIDRRSSTRVPLRAVGDGKYQINLASPKVEAVLAARVRRRQPTFSIFAESATGKVAASEPVRYQVAYHGSPRLIVTGKGADSRVVLPSITPTWVSSDKVTKLVAAVGDATVLPIAFVGDETIRFERDTQGEVSLAMTDALRAAWLGATSMRIELQPRRQPSSTVVLRARPAALELPTNPAQMIVKQRETQIIPGSAGYLRVSLDDITAGQVLVSLRDREGGNRIERRSMREGDEVAFQLGERRYVLALTKLANLLFGDDYAELSLGTTGPTTRRRIEALLNAIATSGLVFVRNGEPWDSRGAAAHLRRKHRHVFDKITTAEEFIEQLATKSSQTGKPYLVRTAAGEEVPLARWLTERDKELEVAYQAKKAAAKKNMGQKKGKKTAGKKRAPEKSRG